MATTPPSAQEVKRGARPGRKKGCPPGALKGVSGQDVKGASPPGALKGVSAQDVKRGSLGSCSCIPHGGGDGRGGGMNGLGVGAEVGKTKENT